MKKTVLYLIGVAVLFAAASCVKNSEFENEGSVDGFSITFTCGEMPTRAVGDPVPGVNNENLIRQIDYFIFPCDANGVVADDTEYAYKGEVIPQDDGLSGSYSTGAITTRVLNEIFPNGATKAVVFAVANFVDYYGAAVESPVTTIPENIKTWKGLHELQVGESFFKDGGDGFELRWPRVMKTDDEKLFFVMVGEKVVELKKSGEYAISDTIDLKRLASKATVSFTYAEQVIENDIYGKPKVKWVPLSEDVETRVYLSNAIEHSTLGGPITRTLVPDSWANCTKPNVHEGTVGNGTRDIFEYAYDYMKDIKTVDGAGNKLAHYYTYPISMEEGDDNQPYLKLVLPWIGYSKLYDDESGNPVFATEPTKQKEVYYKIVLPRETLKDPNMIYEFQVYVDIVGSDKEVNITGEKYVVKDWSHDNVISSNVGMARYISLDIPKDTYDMYGDKVQILYVSSGEVEISQLQIYKPNVNGDPNKATNDIVLRKDDEGNLVYGTYSTRTGNGTTGNAYRYGTANYSANTADADGVTVPNWVSVSGSQLIINHALNTNINNSGVDITPYKFVVTLHLKGETSTRFDRTVTVTQYPPIYAESFDSSSSSTVFLNGQQYTVGTNTTVYNNAGESLGTIGLEGASQTANTRTIVTVTTLASLDVSRYSALGIATPIIGDPRIRLGSKYPVNPGAAAQTWETNDLGTDANNHIADYLYADLEKSNVIAPRFMLASGYGSCAGTKVDWIHNVERCAAYQEDGYPAGRWRLPTEAEMVFVYNLAHDLSLLSNPFYSTSNYWANSGRRYYNGSFQAAGGGNYSSRCVYDLWYWGDEPVLTPDTTPSNTQWSGYMTTK